MVFRDSGQPEMAELQWRQILDEHPNFKPARMLLNEILIHENRLTTAQVEAQRLMESCETLIAGVILMARVDEKRGRAERALELLEQYQDEFDESADLFSELSRLTFLMGKNQKAKAALTKLIKLAPDDASAHFNLGTLYWQEGEFELALAACETSLSLRPDHSETVLRIAELKKKLKQE